MGCFLKQGKLEEGWYTKGGRLKFGKLFTYSNIVWVVRMLYIRAICAEVYDLEVVNTWLVFKAVL